MEIDRLIAAERMLESKLIENSGELAEGEEVVLTDLSTAIETEVEKYAFFLKNNRFDSIRDELKKHKKSIDAKLKQLDAVEGIITHKVATVLEERGPIDITVSGIDKQIEVGYTKRRNVIEESTDASDGKWILEVEPLLYRHICEEAAMEHLIKKATHKVLIADLPEGHKAITVKLVPNIKIVNRRR